MSNNPKRVPRNARTLGMTADEFEEKNTMLKTSITHAVNLLGFDAKLGLPDHVVAEFMVMSMWNLGCALNNARDVSEDPTGSIGLNTGFGSLMDGEG